MAGSGSQGGGRSLSGFVYLGAGADRVLLVADCEGGLRGLVLGGADGGHGEGDEGEGFGGGGAESGVEGDALEWC